MKINATLDRVKGSTNCSSSRRMAIVSGDTENSLLKCLATGGGQCSSMPVVYLSLAERLGATAYLSLAPQHSFIKYPDKAGNIVNYEPTSNWKISDKWYADNMAITPEARRSGIYLDTLNSRAIVADCILSLAAGYMQKYGSADGRFVDDCLGASMPCFKRPHIQALFIKSAQLARMLHTVVINTGIRSFDDIPKSPQANEYYTALSKNEALIKNLGYRDEPRELYAQLIRESEFKGKVQAEKGIDGKHKRSMFTKTK